MSTFKILIISLCLIIGSLGCDDTWPEEYKECYDAGQMKCEDNKAKMCEADYLWWTQQDCNTTGQTCIYNQPAQQSGFVGLATCEDLNQ